MVYELEKEHKKSSLMCKKKEELAKEIMRLEHNVNAMNERLGNQANAIKRYEQESRAKAIDDVLEKALEWNKNSSKKVPYAFIHFIAEELKGVQE